MIMSNPHIRIKSLLFVCATVASLALTSCFKQQEDLFDEPASTRLQSTMDKVRTILRGAEYGWEFEYYPGSELEYGGIVYLLKFDSLTVDVACSLIPDSVETTYYRMTNDNGPVLTFDTFNSLIHYFSTPSSGEYEAKGGEFEFVVNEISDDEITLYGKKTGNTMYLRRLTAPTDDYASRTVAIFDNFVKGFEGEVEGSFDLVNRRMYVSGDSLGVPFTFNDKGIRFYRPIRLGNSRVQALEYNTETHELTGVGDDAASLTLQGVPFPDDIMHFGDYAGRYTMRYQGGQASANVEFVPNRLECNYRLRGLSPMYELVMQFDYETGDMILAPQVVGQYGGTSVYFATYGSGVWVAPECSFTIRWNKNRFYPTFTFSPTDSRYDCESALLITLYELGEGYGAEIIDDAAWATNGSCVFLNLVSFFKLRE